MNFTVGVLALTLLAAPLAAEAQQPTNIPRIGFLTAVLFSSNAARIEAFRQGLRELGYVEGKNIVIEWRSAEGTLDRLPSLAAELVRLKVDVIVTGEGRSASRTALDEGGRYLGIPRNPNFSRLTKCPRNRVRYRFTEGFDTSDLRETRTLLEELS